MRFIKQSILAVGALVAVAGFASTAVSAEAVFTANDKGNTTVSKGEVVDGSAYLAGNAVRVSGTVKGDVYCAASTVTIDGTVDGDVLCAGSNVTVNGTVKGDVRVAGATVTLGGTVLGNASVFGADVTADSSLKLTGDLTGGASNLTIDGMVGRDMVAGAGLLTINGTIGRDVTSAFTNVSFGDSASVKGNFAYTSENEATIPASAVSGKTDYTHVKAQSQQSNAAFGAMFVVLATVAVGVLAMLGVILFPRQVHNAAAISWGKFGIAVVVGLTFISVVPFTVALLLISGVGMLVAYALILLWLLVMAVSPVTFAYFLGSKIYGSRSDYVLVRATLGALVLMFALLIPLLNVFVFIVMVLSGVGMMFLGMPRLYDGSPYQVNRTQSKTVKKKAA